jgi:phosphatidylglycerophosphate synthase
VKVLITLPHHFFVKKVAGVPLIVRIIKVFQQAGITDIYIMSNILDLKEDGSIQVIRKKEEIPEKLGNNYFLVDIPVVFDQQFLQSLLEKQNSGTVQFSKINPENYQGIFVPVHQDKDIKKAEKALLRSLRKSADTFVSRNLNRPVSLLVSRYLMKTPITPNMITFFVLFVGILASYILVVRADYWAGLIGGTLFHLASVLDGCDGEIARLKFQSSKLGLWLDNISDELTNFLFTGALGIYCASYFKEITYLYIGMITMGVFLVTKVIQYLLIYKGEQNQDIARYSFEFEKKKEEKWTVGTVLFEIGKNMARNDFMALGMMVAGILGWMHVGLIVIAFFVGSLFISVVVDLISRAFHKNKPGVSE